jgi:hypothetical protein
MSTTTQAPATRPSTLDRTVPGRAARLAARIDYRARRKLPRPVYQGLVGRYHDARTLTGTSPGRGRLTPDFIIVGAAKAGTTSLYGWLSRHPYIEPATKKEVHFFDYNYFRGRNWYRSHFPTAAEQSHFAAEHGRPFITGEASPSYITHEWAPHRLAAMLPGVKLIVGLRNPVDRAYSQYQMSVRENEEPLDFAQAVAVEEERLEPERARMRADKRYNSWPIGCWSYLMRSRYAEQVERWLTLFPRSQFHFVSCEELAADPQGALDDVHAFLEIPSHAYADLKPLHTASYDALDPAVRAQLTDYFRPHNERLYELIGRDLGWE